LTEESTTYDRLVHNGRIVTVNGDFDILDRGWVGITDGRIASVGQLAEGNLLPPALHTTDARDGIVMPGLVNTHTHLPMTLFRGLADDLPLQTWLQEHIFPAETRHINPETVEAGALLGCAEMLLGGTTTCCDGYFLEDVVAEAVQAAGLRGVLGQGVIDFPAPGVPDCSRNIDQALAYVARWQNADPLISPSIFCHSPYTCSAETLQNAKRAADRHGLLFQIHAAETRDECDRIQAEQGVTVIRYLDRLGLLDHNTLLVHGVWMDEEEMELIARRGSRLSHNPQSNMKLAAGIAPIPQAIAAGITVGLGTDGCASNNNLDLFEEMDAAAKLHKVRHLDPTVMDAATVLRMATIEGARAIGLNGEVGSLEVGKQADLIILDGRRASLVPIYNPVSHIVYAAHGGHVRDVVVGGRLLVCEGRLMDMDLEGIMARVNRIADAIRSGKNGP